MSVEMRLPELGEGIESADILDVLVNVGDEVAKDQGILEIETDKATVEVPCAHKGRVSKIHVKAGQSISIGQLLITLEAKTSAATSKPKSPKPKAKTAPVAKTKAEAPEERVAETPAATPTPPMPSAPAASTSPVEEPVAVAPAETAAKRSSTSTAPAGPAIRRFAREVGVDLATVAGSGAGGRITRDDVLTVVRQSSKPAIDGEASENDASVPGTPATDSWGPIGLEPTPKIVRTIAGKMHQSWSTVPRVTNFDDADVTELEKIRQTSKADYAAAGIKLTSMPFVIKSVAMALQNHPLMNASIDEENKQTIYKQYVSIGIAVDTERGLVVPAVRNADQLSIAETARELASVAEKARDNKFTIEDLRGSTFTISNLGAIGGTYSTPIVNVPEVAILLVGRSRKMPVVFKDEIAVRLMMPLSLSYDHRLVDGATAARFLNEVIGYLQAPGRLLLAP